MSTCRAVRFWASFSQDPSGRERERAKRVLRSKQRNWEVIVLDSPQQLVLRGWVGDIKPEPEWMFIE